MDWYQPDLSAWDVFETWDLVLAGGARRDCRLHGASVARGPDTWLIVPAVVAVVVVVVSLVNHPPGTAGTGDDPMIGTWLALAASVLMLAGLVLSVARISVAVNLADQPPGTPAPSAGFGRERRAPMPPPSASAAPTAPLAGDPRTEPPHAIDNDTPR